jgi:hypothetical protein
MNKKYYNEWFNSIRKLLFNNEVDYFKYEKCKNNLDFDEEELYKKRMNTYKSAQKLYLYIIETKSMYFSIQPKYLSFWKTINKKRYDLLDDIENKLKIVYNNEERRYLMIYKTTLKRYDSTYGLSIGLALHRKFNQDIALLIYEYM